MYEAFITTGKTISKIDEYRQSGEKYFKILDRLNVRLDHSYYSVNFLISNKVNVRNIIRTNITMTSFSDLFKNISHSHDLNDYIDSIYQEDQRLIPKITVPVLRFLIDFRDSLEDNKDIFNEIIELQNPIAINAQSSLNRSGYGNYYYQDQLMSEGTLYGETSEYPIVGYILSKG